MDSTYFKSYTDSKKKISKTPNGKFFRKGRKGKEELVHSVDLTGPP
jgi:hypothetical protein